jgi:hypothetical protein
MKDVAWECFNPDCRKVSFTPEGHEKKCPSCGSTNGHAIGADRLKEGPRFGCVLQPGSKEAW